MKFNLPVTEGEAGIPSPPDSGESALSGDIAGPLTTIYKY